MMNRIVNQGTAHRVRRRGFTMVELIVVITIIVVLIGLAFVAFRGAMMSAGRTESASALRQMMVGFTNYARDHNGAVMPGYMHGTTLTQFDITARLSDGEKLLPCADDHCDLSPYVWRLAPYLDDAVTTFTKDYRSKQIDTRIGTEIGVDNMIYGSESRGETDIGVAHFPAYGMNTYFIGGDDVHTPVDVVPPWDTSVTAAFTPEIAIERLSQAKQPSQLLVFTPVIHAEYAAANPVPVEPRPFESVKGGFEVDFGYAEARPPFSAWAAGGADGWSGQQWAIDKNGQAYVDDSFTFHGPDGGLDGGVPHMRWGNSMPIGNMDGSTEMVKVGQLLDMGRWSATRTTDAGFEASLEP